MHYVYVIESRKDTSRIYVGYSTDLKERIKAHNSGQSTYTAKYKPWKLLCYLAFANMDTAKLFEKYLKTDSGKVSFNKRLVSQ